MISGAFFNFEISPILVIHQETRQSFAHFATSCVPDTLRPFNSLLTTLYRTCAVVGGVLTVASLIDSVLFAANRKLKKHGGSSGVTAYTNGKLM